MGFKGKEVSGAREYRGWRDWSEGDFVIGIYTEDGEQDSDYGIQLWFDIEVEESNFNFDTKSGKRLRLNGNGALNPKMEMINHGTKVKVQFDGYDVLTKGKFKGKEFADVKVWVDDSEETQTAKAATATTTAEPEVDYSGL